MGFLEHPLLARQCRHLSVTKCGTSGRTMDQLYGHSGSQRQSEKCYYPDCRTVQVLPASNAITANPTHGLAQGTLIGLVTVEVP